MTTHTPDNEHVAFEAMCAQVQDYETLPNVTPNPLPDPHDDSINAEQQAAPLNEMILAGLVSP